MSKAIRRRWRAATGSVLVDTNETAVNRSLRRRKRARSCLGLARQSASAPGRQWWRLSHDSVVANRGDQTWQVEALDPRTLAGIVTAAIEGRIERALYGAVLEEEQNARQDVLLRLGLAP